MENTKNMISKYVWRDYRILKQELSKYNTFDIDDRYFGLRRDFEICKQFLRNIEPQMAKYI